jgi:hypothetical protein
MGYIAETGFATQESSQDGARPAAADEFDRLVKLWTEAFLEPGVVHHMSILTFH